MENRIKEQFSLFADRVSTETMRSNQMRLYLSTMACILVSGFRRVGLKGTELTEAQVSTIRTKLLEIGAQIRVTVRKVWVSMASIPVFVVGAKFQIGDGHAAQGNGEVDITALETSLTGTLQFIVRKDMRLTWPRAETPTHYITMGMHAGLTKAARIAVCEATAVDFSITQLVDGNKGVDAMILKSLFIGSAPGDAAGASRNR